MKDLCKARVPDAYFALLFEDHDTLGIQANDNPYVPLRVPQECRAGRVFGSSVDVFDALSLAPLGYPRSGGRAPTIFLNL